MKSVIKRMTVVCMAFVMILSMMPLLGAVTDGAEGAQPVYAESEADVNVNGFTFHIWYGSAGASVALRGYSGAGTNLILPTSVTYNGVTYKAGGNVSFFISEGAFKGNTTIKKIAVPEGYEAISQEAFKGCSSLQEVAIADSVIYISSDIFDNCNNLTKYCYSGAELLNQYSESAAIQAIIDSGMAQDANGNPINGVTVYTISGSPVEKAVEKIDPTGSKITVITVPEPYNKNTVKPDTSQKGEDGTAYGKGATEDVVYKAITNLKNDKDPKGTAFGILQARVKKAGKNYVTLGWKKVPGAKKYVVYGNLCSVGKKPNKYVRLTKGTAKRSVKFTKVAGKKVRKGTYYKFMVVAFDANNRVISTSKTIHVATTGGKYGNDKAVKTAARKNKISIRKGKGFKLAGKAVPASKKFKVKRHRKVAYESSNPAVATVNAKGVIKGKKKGSCFVYAYAQNGVFSKIKVTVK